MALRKILMEGDPLLRKKCRVVEKFDGRLAALFDDLKETLSAVEGWIRINSFPCGETF